MDPVAQPSPMLVEAPVAISLRKSIHYAAVPTSKPVSQLLSSVMFPAVPSCRKSVPTDVVPACNSALKLPSAATTPAVTPLRGSILCGVASSFKPILKLPAAATPPAVTPYRGCSKLTVPRSPQPSTSSLLLQLSSALAVTSAATIAPLSISPVQLSAPVALPLWHCPPCSRKGGRLHLSFVAQMDGLIYALLGVRLEQDLFAPSPTASYCVNWGRLSGFSWSSAVQLIYPDPA